MYYSKRFLGSAILTGMPINVFVRFPYDFFYSGNIITESHFNLMTIYMYPTGSTQRAQTPVAPSLRSQLVLHSTKGAATC